MKKESKTVRATNKRLKKREAYLAFLRREMDGLPNNCRDALIEARKRLGITGAPVGNSHGSIMAHFDIVFRASGIKRPQRGVDRKPAREEAAAKSENFLESFEWRRARYEAIKRHGRRCLACGRTPADGVTIHVDHIKPRRHFPELALEQDNLQVLCHECNHGKGNWDRTDWR